MIKKITTVSFIIIALLAMAISSLAYDISWIVSADDLSQTIDGSSGTVRWTGFSGADEVSLIIDNSAPELFPASVTLTYSFIEWYTYPNLGNYSSTSLMASTISSLVAGDLTAHDFYLNYIATRLSGLITYGDGSYGTYNDGSAVINISEDSVIVAYGNNCYIGDYTAFISAPTPTSGLTFQFKTNVVITVPVSGISVMQFDYTPYDFGNSLTSATGYRFRGNGDLSDFVYTTEQSEQLKNITLVLAAAQSDISELLSILNQHLPNIDSNITAISLDINSIKSLIVNPIIPNISQINSNSQSINNFLKGDFFAWEKENASEINNHLVNLEEYAKKIVQSLGLDDEEAKEASEKVLSSLESSESNVIGGYSSIVDEFSEKVDYTTLEVLNEYYFKSNYPQNAGKVFFDSIDSFNFIAGTLGVITLFLNYAVIFSLLRYFG